MNQRALVARIGDADIKLLRIFKSVVESGGLSAAEVDLNIGKSTISKHIADLEHRLDLKLCNRGPAGFSLTEDGDKVLRAAENLLASVSHFRTEVNDIKQKLVGTIRVALFDQCASNPESHLAQAIHRFNRAAPGVEIELSLEPPNIIETMVIGGQLDLGIVALHRPSSSLDYAPLYGENMYLYCGKGHRFFGDHQSALGMQDVRAANYAGISVNSPNLYIGQKLGLRRAAKVQSEQALAILIMSGRYLGFLPDHLAKEFVRRELMQAVLPDHIHYRTRFAAITRKRPVPTRTTKLFLETLLDQHAG
ncbi:LysR family transcriptional regulator [Ruegeria sp. HKCCD8929]|uniref:LysR family transcriptional regulator n=1 Tax=Ruegeria sp. HKCCD8929 TaxID=2683006 RepID=UPI001489BFC9|nr:LysR family transcriptional regulator [Ruegeria sp. HKCCD8929]